VKKLIFVSLCSLLLVSGCARHYVIHMNNGNQIVANGKPKFNGSAYTFKDTKGRERSVPRGRVSSISPASMSKHEESSARITIEHPKKRHWYTLWLFKS
jgi:uncharacterized protein YcfL